MKKFLLVFISILSISFLLVNNKTNAQEIPNVIIKTNYNRMYRQPDNEYTYEFTAYYQITGDYSNITINDYYFIINQYIPMFKGTSQLINSYWINNITYFEDSNYTRFYLRVTLLKDFVDSEYSFNEESPNYIGNFFSESILYVKYISDDYTAGYNTGYNTGYNDGLEVGYDEGYLNGHLDGYGEGYTYGYQVGQENGYNEGYDVGYNTGRDDGYNEGYDVGYNTGKNDGHNEGYDVGYNEGYINGYQLGHEEGYSEGYDDGIRADDNESYQRGYNDGSTSSFLSKIHIWIIPAIILVFFVGIFVAYRRSRE